MVSTKQVGFVLAALAFATPVVLAHMKVVKTVPEQGSTVSKVPTAVQVWYTQEPDGPISKLSLEGPQGDVKLLVHPGEDNSLMGMIEDANLGNGDYHVTWQTAGDDGHIQKGEYTFTVKRTE